MTNNETYRNACVLAIRTIDDEFYGRKKSDQIKILRRVLDYVLNFDADLENWQEDPLIDRAKRYEGVE